MSDIFPVKKQRIFGLDAPDNEMGVIGSGASGSSTTSKDIEDIQARGQYLLGYNAMTKTFNNSDLPFSEELNSLFYMITRQLAYLQRAGISEWKATIEYYEGSFVRHGGKIYQALKYLPGVEAAAPDADTPPAPDAPGAANSWAEIDQIQELKTQLQTVQALAERNTTDVDRRVTADIKDLKGDLEQNWKTRVPLWMTYIQHRGSDNPADLFGGRWEIFIDNLPGSPILRYESSAFGVVFPKNERLSQNIEWDSTEKVVDSRIWGDTSIHNPNRERIINSFSPLRFNLNQEAFEQVGQTIRVWRKTSHDPVKA